MTLIPRYGLSTSFAMLLVRWRHRELERKEQSMASISGNVFSWHQSQALVDGLAFWLT